MPARNLGERKSLVLDDGVGLDQQGYLLAPGDTAEAKKAGKTDSVIGVNYTSTLNADDTEVRTGVPVPVIHDGYPLVLADYGNNYSQGDAIYVSDSANNNSGQAGIATNVADEGVTGTDGTKVGNVVAGAGMDLTGETELGLIQVDITSNLGDSA